MYQQQSSSTQTDSREISLYPGALLEFGAGDAFPTAGS
jgi:hypothetical protein